MSDTVTAPARVGWRHGALCAQTDLELFFPPRGNQNRAAKAVCAQCPVCAECLDYALTHRESYGIWGGTTERERRALAARRRAVA